MRDCHGSAKRSQCEHCGCDCILNDANERVAVGALYPESVSGVRTGTRMVRSVVKALCGHIQKETYKSVPDGQGSPDR